MIVHRSRVMETLSGVQHGFFGVTGGVSKGVFSSLNGDLRHGDLLENVLENRRRAMAALGCASAPLLTLSQVHGTEVKTVTEPWTPENAPLADGMVTDIPNLALGILTADCAPVLFADPCKKIIGACHAGWRGAFAGILEKTIQGMEALGSRRRDIVASAGPMIAQESYEVDGLFYETFLHQDAHNAAFFKAAPKPGHFFFDLPGFVEKNLQMSDLDSIDCLRHDTFHREFFSRRRMLRNKQSNHGCNLSIIMLSF